jgi:pyruvate, water dikinase
VIVSLEHAHDAARFGGKAAQLSQALRAGLPVPPGFGLSSSFVSGLVANGTAAQGDLVRAFLGLGRPVAVRSSAIGEDSAGASFAGQHETVLNVRTPEALLAAVTRVHGSGRTEAALGYRQKLGLAPQPEMGVVMQALVAADCSGVLFTRHPISGADERVIEAAWGLGEAVVAGLVTPDRYRVARGGRVLERSAGDKDLAIVWDEAGGTSEIAIEPRRAGQLCLSDARLARLDQLASRCEAAFGDTQDLEWSFAGDDLFLLQRRAITRG